MITTNCFGRTGRNLVVWGAVVAVSILAGRVNGAEFTTAFDGVTAGSDLAVSWEGISPQHYPLSITAQLIEKKGDGHKANAYKANITEGATGNMFTWTGVPFPLKYVPSGMYQLELRPSTWTEGEPPLLALSPFFTVGEKAIVVQPSPSPVPTLVDYQSNTASNINKPLAIGLGVAIGVPSVIALAVVSWCFRRRQRRASLEKRRRKRSEFIID
ncbi:hypothetical protein B0H67DRAFT_160083 [Lasiosphaeris hirsuta]|uniref:Uncharacterized protein n=1 Tax=Lasiosphaeris hirsuta TaxID=260670 RepID=A0AA40APP0_9PEZI|nr:hypothetical protein B0H67DRAFT_160083 [Lasiosphaeris hirsuta]